jgi:hypothetical protein
VFLVGFVLSCVQDHGTVFVVVQDMIDNLFLFAFILLINRVGCNSVLQVANGAKVLLYGVARVLVDNAVCGGGLSIYAECEVVYAPIDRDIQKVNTNILFLFKGKLHGGCGTVKVVEYGVDISGIGVVYQQNIVNVTEVA